VEHSEGDDDTTAESEFGCGDIARVDAIIENMIFCSRAATPAAVLFPPPPPPPATFPTTTDKVSALAYTMLILKHSPPSLIVQFPIEQQKKKSQEFFYKFVVIAIFRSTFCVQTLTVSLDRRKNCFATRALGVASLLPS
jgi:hypothetical protein